jgi:hypothetical protein
MLMFKKLCTFLFLVTAVVEARADAAFLLEEPYGHFGAINPTGHAAVYLSGVCADSPTRLRRCSAGEAGVVLSRYHRIAGRDWVAIPLVPYLYAVERPKQIPAAVDVQKVSELRDAYRRLMAAHRTATGINWSARPMIARSGVSRLRPRRSRMIA